MRERAPGDGGFGLFERSGREFQDRAVLATGAEMQTIYLQAVNPSDVAYLVQKLTPDGEAAETLLSDSRAFQLPLAAPQDAGPIDRLQRLAKLKASAKVVHCGLAVRERPIIVHHDETAG